MTPENTMSVDGQHALQDMVEFEMYLVSQSQQRPWPMLPRRSNKATEADKSHGKSIEPSAVMELIGRGFIEASSSKTFVVSKSGYQFYERELKNLGRR